MIDRYWLSLHHKFHHLSKKLFLQWAKSYIKKVLSSILNHSHRIYSPLKDIEETVFKGPKRWGLSCDSSWRKLPAKRKFKFQEYTSEGSPQHFPEKGLNNVVSCLVFGVGRCAGAYAEIRRKIEWPFPDLLYNTVFVKPLSYTPFHLGPNVIKLKSAMTKYRK